MQPATGREFKLFRQNQLWFPIGAAAAFAFPPKAMFHAAAAKMTFLPIVERELRVAARRRSTYWMRAAMGLACIALGAFLHFESWAVSPQILGKRIFVGLTWVALFYCLFAGRRSTADSLSEEKREGTLGLLFLTDLKGYDVVLGKVAATSLNAFYGLLAVLPVMAIPLLLGGISSGEFWRVVLVLVDTFLFSLSVGIAVSAMSRDARKALGVNLVLLIALIGLPPAAAGAIAYFSPSQPFVAPLFFSCPIFSLYLSEDIMYAPQKWHFWGSVIVLHLLTWLLLALASTIVPRSWQDKTDTTPAATGKKSWREKWQAWTYGTFAQRLALRRRLLEKGAYYWLAARGRFKPAQVWVLLGLVASWWVWAWLKSGGAWRGEVLNPINVLSAILLNSALKLWLAIEAGRQIAEDRKSGAFELLLATPLGPRDILRGQWRALIRQFLGPLLVLVAVELMFMLHDLNEPPRSLVNSSDESGMAVCVWMAGIVMLVTDTVALGWVAMWTSLRSRSANHATIGTLVRILVLPWLVLWIVSGVVSTVAIIPGRPQPQWPFYLGWWFGSGMAANILFGLIAWTQLHTQFRQLAAHSFAPAGSRLRRWFGREN